MLQVSFSEHPDLPTSLLCFIVFTGYLLSRGPGTSCLCFKIISHQASIYLLELFTFTLLPGSSALLQTPGCSEYHPSTQSPVVSALSVTRLQLSGTNFLFMSAILLLLVLSNLSERAFSFFKNKVFFSRISQR